MTTFETLTVDVADGLGHLTLDQPEHLNPLGNDALAELAQAAEWMDDNGAVVVIVTGAGDRAFSAGFDLRQWADNSQPGRPKAAPEAGPLLLGVLSLSASFQGSVRLRTGGRDAGSETRRYWATAPPGPLSVPAPHALAALPGF